MTDNNAISLQSQLIGLESVHNARELGGYAIGERRVRKGLLIRCANLNVLSERDSRILSERFHLGRIYDFRGLNEAALAPDIVPQGAVRISFSVSLTPNQRSLKISAMDHRAVVGFLLENASHPELRQTCEHLYENILLDSYSQEVYRQFFSDLVENADGEHAVIMHCTQGKDRAGCASALLLAALGADRDLIIRDYRLTGDYYDPMLARIPVSTADQKRVLGTILGADYKLFNRTLDLVESRYGSLESYLEEVLGVTPEMREILCGRYLERA